MPPESQGQGSYGGQQVPPLRGAVGEPLGPGDSMFGVVLEQTMHYDIPP